MKKSHFEEVENLNQKGQPRSTNKGPPLGAVNHVIDWIKSRDQTTKGAKCHTRSRLPKNTFVYDRNAFISDNSMTHIISFV